MSPGCTSSEARTEYYDADVSPGMTTREILGMELRVDKEDRQIWLYEENTLKVLLFALCITVLDTYYTMYFIIIVLDHDLFLFFSEICAHMDNNPNYYKIIRKI